MNSEIEKRFTDLIEDGKKLTSNIPVRPKLGGPEFWVEDQRVPEYQAWFSSVVNLIRIVSPSESYFVEECQRLSTHDHMKSGVPYDLVHKLHGLLNSAFVEWKSGLLAKVEYMVAAETFDDFLDQAEQYHKSNKKIEASVLGGAVLEDVMKKIARKNGIDPKGMTLEPLIDELVKKNVFTPVKAKRQKVSAAVRNHALHAEWDRFDIKDVGQMLSGTRDLVEENL